MFWKKKTKEKEPEYEYTDVPKEHAEKCAELYDAMMDRDSGMLERHRFWAFIGEVLPGAIGTICWRTHTQPALRRIKADSDSDNHQSA